MRKKSATHGLGGCLDGGISGSQMTCQAATLARRLARADLSLTMGDASSCADQAREILAQDKDHVGALEVLAKALWQTCEFSELMVVIDRLMELNPYEPGYHSLRGAAYQAMGRYGDAVRAMVRGNGSDGGQSLAELQDWQADLVAALLQEDSVFRAHYSQNPERACLDRGFAFANAPTSTKWVSERLSSELLYTRPS